MRLTLKSRSSQKTKEIARYLAGEIIKTPKKKAFVLALEGNLGSGKTTFTQGFARKLGIKEKVLSPTFVLMKVYSISQKPKAERQKPNSQMSNVKIYPLGKFTGFARRKPSNWLSTQMFRHLIHIDCYRIKSIRELAHLGFKNLLKDKDAIILIEWANRIRKLVPKDAVWIKFRHGVNSNQRIIEFKTQNAKRKITTQNSKYFKF